jgi:hypothetical protein
MGWSDLQQGPAANVVMTTGFPKRHRIEYRVFARTCITARLCRSCFRRWTICTLWQMQLLARCERWDACSTAAVCSSDVKLPSCSLFWSTADIGTSWWGVLKRRGTSVNCASTAKLRDNRSALWEGNHHVASAIQNNSRPVSSICDGGVRPATL